jgi:prepilin-type processing-associated H-X9-DG protein/prepilin-type N-terminal cleavage/methylation domain-containing protein
MFRFGSFGLGFSLVELLVVIAILGLVASLVVPAAGKIQEKARSAGCLSNLRQIGVGLSAYLVGETTGKFPPAFDGSANKTLADQLAPYLPTNANSSGVFKCPGSAKKTLAGSRTTYGAHPRLCPDISSGPPASGDWVALSQVTQPSKTIVLADCSQSESDGSSHSTLWNPWQAIWGDQQPGTQVLPEFLPKDSGSDAGAIRYRHSGMANVLMADGHTETRAAGKIFFQDFWLDKQR